MEQEGKLTLIESMETNAGLVAGSYIGNELVVIDSDTGSHTGNELVETNAGLVTGSHIQNELVETNAGLVAGSYIRNELMVILEEDIKLMRFKALKQYSEPLDYWSAQMCRICGENVELSSTGDVFVACYECDFPVCQPCYEYERREGHQSCPQCNTRYKRHKGCPPVEGDDESDDVSSDMKDGFVHGEPQREQGENLDKFLDSGDKSEHPSPSFINESQYPTLLTDGNVSEDLSNAIPDSESTLAITSGSLDYGENDCYSLSCVESNQPERIVDRSKDLNSYAIVQDYLNDSVERLENEHNMTKMIINKGKGKMEYMDFGSYELQMDYVTDQPLNSVVPDSPDLPPSKTKGQPLSCVVPIPVYLLILYRTLIVLRLLVLIFFFRYRITNPVPNAYPLWLVSVVCEIWFALSWLLDQFPKWSPINRETFIDRLALRYDQEGEPSQLAPIDIFVSTVDPQKEPPIVTANTVLSILAVDYPVEKVSCYVSDDGAAMLTFETLSVTAEFATMWVPFCKKHNVEPRAPEYFFAQKINYYEDRMLSSFVRDRRNMKRAYGEFKVKINALVAKTWDKPREGWMMDGSPWPGNNPRDHPGMIQVFLGHNGALDTNGNALPRLVYVSREKRPGFQHYKKAGAMNALIRVSAVLTNGAYILNLDCDHYINNSKALREAMCFFMDPVLRKKTCYVQFPQRFDGIDRSDRYANRNVVFFDVNLRGLDGIQGPVYVGTGCCFNRQALYGNDPMLTKADLEPNIIVKICGCSRKMMDWFSNKTYNIKKLAKIRTESQSSIFNLEAIEEGVEGYDDGISDIMPRKGLKKRFGRSSAFINATLLKDGGIPPKQNPALLLKEAIHVISCSYEGKTEWGKEVGWIYGSVTEDILTGLKMHARGWSSIYCMPDRPAFKGSAPLNLSDRLHQVLRWALGSIEILFSKHCPIWYSYGGRLKLLQRIAYINTTVYPLTSFPLIAYCTLPAICLLTGKFIIPQIGNVATIWFGVFFASVYLTGIMELKWSGISIEDWWRNEQFWVIGGTSAHVFAVFQGMLKVIAGIDTNFTVTSKASDEDGDFGELYSFKWTSLLIIPTTLLILNLVAIMGAVAYDIESGFLDWGPLLGKLFFSMWVIIHLYPFMKGLLGRQNRIPTIVIVWSVLIISIFSLIWVRTDPLSNSIATAAIATQCGFDCETF